MRATLLAALAVAAAVALAGWGGASSPPVPAASTVPAAGDAERGARAREFRANERRITGNLRERVVGSSWRRGCPVPLRKLRLLRVSHWDFDRDYTEGSLIVHRRETGEIRRAMRALFEAKFPIRRMHLIDRYGADDHRSMDADNTSAFNCRFVAGTSRWSEHAYGRALDLNPRENPYVTAGGHVSPPAGAPYADRSRDARGMVHRGDAAYRAFKRSGWKWGGNWDWPKDYQHFSATGN